MAEEAGATVRKADLAKAVAEKMSGMKNADAERAVTAVFEAITDALKEGKSVTLTGFGTFDVAEQGAREGRNPKTGDPIQIAARDRVRFKLGSELDKIRDVGRRS